jgi:hypothetical protein
MTWTDKWVVKEEVSVNRPMRVGLIVAWTR